MTHLPNLSSTWLIIFLCFSYHACGPADSKTGTTVPTASTTQALTENQSNSSSNVEWIKGIPVFKTFESIAPVFEFQSDTTYIINFWATWCKPCVEELPYFEALTEAFPNEKMRVILISLDMPKQLDTKLFPFLEKHQLQSDVMVLTDPKQHEWIDRVNPDWGGAIPVTYIYNQKRRTFIDEQFESSDELNALVKSFL